MKWTGGIVLNNFLSNFFRDFIRKNLGLYLLVLLLFVLGIVFGSLVVNMLSPVQSNEVLSYIEGFFTNVKNIDIDPGNIFSISIANNLKNALAIFMSGLIVIGLPLVFILIIFRGFILGFTVGFLIQELGIKGIIFALLAILPQNLIIIPTIISLGVAATAFALSIMKNRLRHYPEDYPRLIVGYAMFNIACTLLLVMAGLIEGYISPIFIKLVTPYL